MKTRSRFTGSLVLLVAGIIVIWITAVSPEGPNQIALVLGSIAALAGLLGLLGLGK